MKQNWTYKKLGELCSFIKDGDWIESKDQSESGIRLIQTGNIGNGVYKDKEERSKFISESTFSSLGCTEIFEGDCLVSRLPEPIGRCCLLPKLDNRCITAVDCSILRFTEEMLPKYFVYYSQSCYYAIDIENKTTGTTRKRISRKNLEGISIPLPPLSTQQSIVAELDEINNLLSLKRKELDAYDKLAQSLFYEMFGDPVENEKGWEVKKLGDVCKEIGDGLHGTPEYTISDTGCYFVNGNNLESGSIKIKKETKMVSIDTKKKYWIELDENTILISINGTLGKLAYYKGENIILGKSACYLKIMPEHVDKKYLYGLLSSNFFKCYMEDECTGTTIQNVSLKSMRTYRFSLPPLPLQQLFATRIEAIEKQKANVKAAIEKLETLLAARMQYWFE